MNTINQYSIYTPAQELSRILQKSETLWLGAGRDPHIFQRMVGLAVAEHLCVQDPENLSYRLTYTEMAEALSNQLGLTAQIDPSPQAA